MIVILFLMIAMLMLMIVTCLRSSFPLTKSLSLLWASLNIRISQKPPIRKIIRISKIITVSNKIISTTKQSESASAQPQFLPHPGQFFSAHLEIFVYYLFAISFASFLFMYIVCTHICCLFPSISCFPQFVWHFPLFFLSGFLLKKTIFSTFDLQSFAG